MHDRQHTLQFLMLTGLVLMVACKSRSTNKTSDIAYQRIDSLFNHYHEQKMLNGSSLIMSGDQKIYEKSFGYADGKKTLPLSGDYYFNFGSIYKEFPAVAIMQLREEGQLSINDPLSKFLPQLPSWSEKITIRQLLRYSAGLPRVNWGMHKNINMNHVMSDLMVLDSLVYEPGSNYLYTNYSPILLTKIVEQVSGMAFTDYFEKRILKQHWLNQIKTNSQYPYIDRLGMAIPFNTRFEEDNFPILIPLVLYTATPEGIFQWFKKLNDFQIINNESLMLLSQTASVKQGGKQSPLGTTVIEDGKIIKHRHHGSSGNFESLVTRFNTIDLTIVIMTNQKHGNLDELTNQVMEILGSTEL